MKVFILSGMSGSGKSAALNTLEDAGYFAIDNLPGQLLPPLLDLLVDRHGKHEKGIACSGVKGYAIVMDARDRDFIKNFNLYFRLFKSRGIRFKILFFDARDDVLIRRFSETRRRHPLAPFENAALGIRRERDILQGLREIANHLIDTTHLNVHELRKKILTTFHGKISKRELSITLYSFGYRYGLPLEADLIMDVRFLPNPYFINRLQPLSGKHPAVSKFVLKQKEAISFLELLKKLLALLLKQYLQEGKSYLNIGFGCTGGLHRSVVIAEKVARDLKVMGYPVKIYHRDIGRG